MRSHDVVAFPASTWYAFSDFRTSSSTWVSIVSISISRFGQAFLVHLLELTRPSYQVTSASVILSFLSPPCFTPPTQSHTPGPWLVTLSHPHQSYVSLGMTPCSASALFVLYCPFPTFTDRRPVLLRTALVGVLVFSVFPPPPFDGNSSQRTRATEL
jgi:hypothetical protein